jgi:hypothetical protein
VNFWRLFGGLLDKVGENEAENGCSKCYGLNSLVKRLIGGEYNLFAGGLRHLQILARLLIRRDREVQNLPTIRNYHSVRLQFI